jgi:hemerythrin
MTDYVTWKEFYSVGNPSIDVEHKQVIGIINDLHEAMGEGKDQALVKPILDRLLKHTLAHFEHEEHVMQDNEYPDFAQHKALHDEIRQKTIALHEHADLVTGRDLLQFLKDWWLGHIQNQDRKYTPYLGNLLGSTGAGSRLS